MVINFTRSGLFVQYTSRCLPSMMGSRYICCGGR